MGHGRPARPRSPTCLDLDLPVEDWAKEEGIGEDDIRERLTEIADKAAADKAERFGPEIMHYVERSIILQTLDGLWREHIVNLDHLRSVVGFRGYAQRDPLQEYKAEAFELFQSLLNNLRQAVTAQLSRVELVQQPTRARTAADGRPITSTRRPAKTSSPACSLPTDVVVPPENRDPDNPATWGRVGRNEPCPCGSGKKYKHCHGAFESQLGRGNDRLTPKCRLTGGIFISSELLLATTFSLCFRRMPEPSAIGGKRRSTLRTVS